MAQVFAFANRYRGAYSNSLYHAVCPFYCDFNGYQVRKKQLNRQSNLVFYYFSISGWMGYCDLTCFYHLDGCAGRVTVGCGMAAQSLEETSVQRIHCEKRGDSQGWRYHQ